MLAIFVRSFPLLLSFGVVEVMADVAVETPKEETPAPAPVVEDVPDQAEKDTAAAAAAAPAAAAPAAKTDADAEAAAEGGRKQSRQEKKARKAIQKLGLKPVPGIDRVTIKRDKTTCFAITEPDVFKSPGSELYVIFGEAKGEERGAQNMFEAAKQFQEQNELAAGGGEEAPPLTDVSESKAEGAADEEVDATGVEEKDIELVVSQTNVSRGQAIKALKKHNGDIVNAIMELTI